MKLDEAVEDCKEKNTSNSTNEIEKQENNNIFSDFAEKFDTINNLINSKDFQILTRYSENLNSGKKKRRDHLNKNKSNIEKYGKL